MLNDRDLVVYGHKKKTYESRYNINFLMKFVVAFQDMRRDNIKMVDDYAARLKLTSAALGVPLISQQKKSAIQERSFFVSRYINRFLKSLNAIKNFLYNFPMYYEQRKKMLAAKSNGESFKNSILALASNRLYTSISITEPRKYLTSLVGGFLESDKKMVNEIIKSKYIYIFDPLLSSTIWKDKDVFFKEDVFIVDTNFLLFSFMASMYKTVPRFIYNCVFNSLLYKALRSTLKFSFYSLKNILGSIIIIESYREVIDNHHLTNVFMLTSNSFATEILRVYMMQHQACVSLCEVLHGIPTTEFEQYLDKLISFSKANGFYKEHSFVSQVPSLPMYGVFKNKNVDQGSFAINSYLNKYCFESRCLGLSLEEYIKRCCKIIFPQFSKNDNKHIATFIGAATEDPDYFQSNSFYMECSIIFHIKEAFKRLEKELVIIYAVHPLYKDLDFKNNEFFSEHDVIVWQDTIFTWFVSDMSFALFSSALFEADYFGVSSYTSIIEEDGFYPKELLDLLKHPQKKDGEALLSEINKFVFDNTRVAPLSLADKVNRRINKFEPRSSYA